MNLSRHGGNVKHPVEVFSFLKTEIFSSLLRNTREQAYIYIYTEDDPFKSVNHNFRGAGTHLI